MLVCEHVWKQVTQAIEYGAGDAQAVLEQAATHSADCAACAYRLDRLAQAIQTGNAMTCAESRWRLEGLLAAREFDELLDLDLQSVAAHLPTCPECAALAETFEMLKTLERTEPDAAILLPEWKSEWIGLAATGPLWEPVGQGVRRLVSPLHFAWQKGELAMMSAEAAVTAGYTATEVRGRGAPQVRKLRLPDPDTGREIELILRSDAKGRTTLTAVLIESDNGQSLKGTRLVLADGSDPRRIYQRVTGQTPVPLRPGDLLLQLSAQDRRWEIHINFEAPAWLGSVRRGGKRVPSH